MSTFNPFTLKDLASILEMLEKHHVSEFKLERPDEKIFLRRGKQPEKKVRTLHPQLVPNSPQLPSNVIPLVNPAPQQAGPQPVLQRDSNPGQYYTGQTVPAQAQTESVPKKSLKEITSPMVGTFYRRPAVDAEPYVTVGDSVKKGDVLCIVEAMKLMNEIESDTPGKIVEVCLEDGQMVEYGEVLFRIELI